MCGIVGFISYSTQYHHDQMRAIVTAMNDTLVTRGPDDSGIWLEHSIALGHRRLAIQDLSNAGHQPMLSQNQRYVLSYNGEIYNKVEIRQQLEQKNFTGQSDTEVLLAACAEWGVERAVGRCNGMFAFALWDRQQQLLTLARDRLGKKPLYWSLQQGQLLFASQSKAMLQHPQFNKRLNQQAVALFLRYGYVPAPYSIYQAVEQLAPGTLLIIDSKQKIKKLCYWQVPQSNPVITDFATAKSQLKQLLLDATAKRMLADVTLAAFLSGGIDSSLVTALMQAQSNHRVKTYSIGFADKRFDEAPYAKAVADHLQTDHTELRVTARDALDVIPDLPAVYDEPFADSSQIATYLLAKLTRQQVTVALSGDGGDESFIGYQRYLLANQLHSFFNIVPGPIRRSVAQLLQLIPPLVWDKLFCWSRALSGDKLHKLAAVLALSDSSQIYPSLISQWPGPLPVLNTQTSDLELEMLNHRPVTSVIDMQLVDFNHYLPDDILTKVDRASMACSLEVRSPLLDYRVIEYAQCLPYEFKHKAGQSKYILRQILYDYIPPSLIDRPKMGFALPLASWLRHELKDWADDLLSSTALQATDLLAHQPIQKKWQQHLSGRRNWQYPLWNVLMFQAWHQAINDD